MIFSIYTAHLHINKKRIFVLIEIMGKYVSKQFTKEEIQIANKYEKTFNFICN